MLAGDADAGEHPIEASKTAPADDKRTSMDVQAARSLSQAKRE
jgi:hypothetical protein